MKRFTKQALLMLGLAIATVFSSKAQQWGDFTLYSIQNATAAYLLDSNHNAVKTWTFASTAKTGYSSYLLPGGVLLRTVARTGNSFTGGPICGEVQKVDWSGNVIWDYVYSTTNYCTHHDICPMPNGNVLLISYERKTAAEATQAGSSTAIEMWPDKIVEVKPTGATTADVVWEWHAWDHLVQNVNSAKSNYQASIPDHPELLNINYKTSKDWMHMNGVDYNPMLDQVAFSSHNLNEWYVIDHSTTTTEAATHSGGNSGKGGDFLYRWGNPVAYGATGTAILKVTHDAHWIPEGVPNAGYLVGFNNQGVSTSQSSVDQVDPPDSGYNYTRVAGQAYAPSTYLLRHAASGYSSNMGNSQQLPNGNMLVCVATAGKFYELNAAGATLWSKTVTGSVPQAFKYDSCYVFNQAPAIPSVIQSGAILNTAPASSYQWYLNGSKINGATAGSLTPVQNGMYLVRITDSKGCVYQYSPGFKYTVPSGLGVVASISDTVVCPGNSVTLNANPLNAGNAATYSWVSNPAGFTSTLQSPTVSPTASTTYTVTITDSSLTATSSVSVVLGSIPSTPTISGTRTTLTASAASSYQWYLAQSPVGGAISQTYNPTVAGTYQVKVKNATGCESSFSADYAYSTTGIAEAELAGNIVLYPNPSPGVIMIAMERAASSDIRFSITDAVGRKVAEGSGRTSFDLSGEVNGVYYVEAVFADQSKWRGKILLLK